MPTKPINIAQTLEYIYVGLVMSHPISYIPPVGGFVNNDETEFDEIVFNDPDYTAPMWSDILIYNDAAYPWKETQDILAGWYATQAEADNAVSMLALTGILSSYLTSAGASLSFVGKSLTVNGHALSDNIVLDYSDLTGRPTLATVASTGNYNDLSNKPSASKAYQSTTVRSGAFPIFKSGTVTSGIVVFNLTNDGTSTGAALFPNGYIDESVNLFVNDATSSYQMSYAMSNSNKTMTVTANKLTTANILTGLLGQVAANSSVVKLTVWGY